MLLYSHPSRRAHVPTIGLASLPLPILVLGLATPFAVHGQGALRPMPRDLEIRYALSALPAHLRDSASVLVLDPTKGYEPAQRGTNGFTCIVARSVVVPVEFRGDIYVPVCYDEQGTRLHLPVYFDVARWRAAGWSATRVKTEVDRRYTQGVYRAPDRPGIAYMVAPEMRTYSGPGAPVATVVFPHHMVYAPNLSDQDIGGTPPPSPHPFILEPGIHGYMIFALGEVEAQHIVADSHDLLQALCVYDQVLCLPSPRQ